MTNEDTAKQAILIAATLARQWQELCKHLSLSSNANVDDVLLAAEQRGYAAAVTDYQILASSLAKQSRRNRNGQMH